MLSGGIDSCYMLYYYLTQTDYAIHAHHISLRYPSEPRWREEDEASRKIVAFCQRIRPFDYSESRCDIGFKRYVGRDSDTQLLMAARVAPNLRGNVHVAIGLQIDDAETELFQQRMKNNTVQKLWNALCESMDYPHGEQVSRELLMPIMEMNITKKEMMEAMPKELLDLTWSCRRPKYNEDNKAYPCGVCKACCHIKQAGVKE